MKEKKEVDGVKVRVEARTRDGGDPDQKNHWG